MSNISCLCVETWQLNSTALEATRKKLHLIGPSSDGVLRPGSMVHAVNKTSDKEHMSRSDREINKLENLVASYFTGTTHLAGVNLKNWGSGFCIGFVPTF